jgi:hypothetical protein
MTSGAILYRRFRAFAREDRWAARANASEQYPASDEKHEDSQNRQPLIAS